MSAISHADARATSPRQVARVGLTALLALLLTVAVPLLAACGGSDDSSGSTTSSTSSAAASVQDNCYGDDLPAVKSNG